MRTSRSAFLPVLALLAGCGTDPNPIAPTADVPAADVVDAPPVDAASADASAPSSDAVAPDAPTPDVRATPDVPAAPDAPAQDAADPPCGAPDYLCPAGYRCVGLSTVRCVRTAALGDLCRNGGDAPIYCPLAATCEPVDGVSRCVAIGTRNGLCHNSSACIDLCEAGLGCDRSYHCRPGLAPGALCGGDTDFCNEGSACITLNGTARCIAHGAEGGQCWRTHQCDAGLRCTGGNTGGCNTGYACVAGLALDAPCTPDGERCSEGTTCALSEGAMRCTAPMPGTLGARCRQTSPQCDEGATCDNRGWQCIRTVARGGSCEPAEGTTACLAGDTCTGEHRADGGQCAAPGTAPGADCRLTGTPCDGALQCSDFSRYRRTCRAVANVGDACDLGGIRTLCPSSTRCLPSTVTAGGLALSTCATPVAEVEPNDRAAMSPSPIERSTLYRASLSNEDAEDCHTLRMTAGSALWVESTIPLVARLFRASDVEIGRWTMTPMNWGGPLGGVARLDPAAIAALRDLAAGGYRLCVRRTGELATSPAPTSYQLGLGILPRSW